MNLSGDEDFSRESRGREDDDVKNNYESFWRRWTGNLIINLSISSLSFTTLSGKTDWVVALSIYFLRNFFLMFSLF